MTTQDATVATLIETPTIANAFRAWLPDAEKKLTPVEYASAKNFVRAFTIWYDKSNSPDTVETVSLKDVSISEETELFIDEFSLVANPIEQHLDPSTKTTHFGKHCRLITTFLGEHGVIGQDELKRSLETCQYMEKTFPRLQRATWVLHQHEVMFHPALGSKPRPIELDESSEEIDGLWSVIHVGRNFVLGEVQIIGLDDEETKNFPEDPIKIYVPEVVAKMLVVGDALQVLIQKVKNADYWVITQTSEVSSGAVLSEGGINDSEDSDSEDASLAAELAKKLELAKESRDEVAFEKRKADLLASEIPDDGFPNETYNEAWFAARELDVASDEEVGTMWDYSDDEDEGDWNDEDEDEDEDDIEL